MEHDELPILMPAAGWLKAPEQVATLAPLGLPIVTVGSFTLPPLTGNAGDVFYLGYSGLFGLNSIGLKNPGFEAFLDQFEAFVEAAGSMHLRVSISPLKPGDIEYMVRRLCEVAKRLKISITIEVNLGCPNVWDDSGQKPLTSYDREAVQTALQEIERAQPGINVFIAVKFSPVTPDLIPVHAELCELHGVNEIVTSNTFPNASYREPHEGRPRIRATSQDGVLLTTVGGLSGPALLPIALGQVFMFKNHIEQKGFSARVTGVGGIHDGESLRQHVIHGADACQVGTAYFSSDNPGVFSDILTGYADQYL